MKIKSLEEHVVEQAQRERDSPLVRGAHNVAEKVFPAFKRYPLEIEAQTVYGEIQQNPKKYGDDWTYEQVKDQVEIAAVKNRRKLRLAGIVDSVDRVTSLYGAVEAALILTGIGIIAAVPTNKIEEGIEIVIGGKLIYYFMTMARNPGRTTALAIKEGGSSLFPIFSDWYDIDKCPYVEASCKTIREDAQKSMAAFNKERLKALSKK